MTQEEHLEGVGRFNTGIAPAIVKAIINQIYTDFKIEIEAEYIKGRDSILSRSCESCKHHRESELGDAIECIKGIALFTSDYGYFVDRDFMCNRWEQK